MTMTSDHPIDSDEDRAAINSRPHAHDPHAGQEAKPKRPDPDPLSELATIDDSGNGGAPDRPELARQPGSKPGFGPNEFTPAKLEGNPELGIDPREAALRTGNGR